jgi:hypothetical protein
LSRLPLCFLYARIEEPLPKLESTLPQPLQHDDYEQEEEQDFRVFELSSMTA